MGTEETFGIEIPNDVAAKIRTGRIGGLYRSTDSNCVGRDVPHSAIVLSSSPRLQAASRGAQRFELDTPLSSMLHKDQWATVWASVRREVGEPDWPAVVPWLGFLSDGPKTVRQLIWHVVAQLPRPKSARGEVWTRPLIEAQVRRIIRDVTGKEDFPLRADFVKDLGFS
jgi:hypothetical protein